MSTNYNYKEYHRKISYSRRQNYNTCVTENRSQAKGKCTDRQKYWVRRSRILAHFRRQSYEYKQQRKMTAASTVSSLAVKITFEKAKRTVNRGLCKVKRLHVYLSEKSKASIDCSCHTIELLQKKNLLQQWMVIEHITEAVSHISGSRHTKLLA